MCLCQSMYLCVLNRCLSTLLTHRNIEKNRHNRKKNIRQQIFNYYVTNFHFLQKKVIYFEV